MITARGKKMDWHEGLTVQEVLEKLGYALPMAIVNLDGRRVERKDWTATVVPDGATLDAYVMAAGG
jgi:sulfur carrier protein ThiS